MLRLLILLLINYSILHFVHSCSWDSCHPISDDESHITVHLIPHTHDDLGWIKTVDQYYYGARMNLVPVGVQYIYNTVLDELAKNPDRRFSFAETGFLWRWFSSVGDAEKHRLQKFIKNGQIELIGGGWVQNDEATAHYIDIIDQMTFGLQKLTHLFGECGKPKAAWQIDPFGHSQEMANMFYEMGYESLFFARIHYLEKELRLNNKSLEFMWQPSPKQSGNKLYTYSFFQDNYGPPEGFCFDALCGDDPIMDNEELEEYNVEEKVNAFVAHVNKQASYMKTNQVMMLMGSDFQYTNANSWYTNLDKLIKYVNRDTRKNKVKVIYSTPTCYTNAVMSKKPKLESKTDDMFPYASSNHSYWTGYFTSRPTFKGMIREASHYLNLAKQLDFMGDLNEDKLIDIMKKASALVQHHDGVTGTAKEAVTQDYVKQLARGMSQLQTVINEYLTKRSPKAIGANVVLCPLLNETICEPMNGHGIFPIVVFNSDAHYYNGTIRIPLYEKTAKVTTADGRNAMYQIVGTFATESLKDRPRAPFEIHVGVNVPPLGYTTIFVEISGNKYRHPKLSAVRSKIHQSSDIENEFFRVSFDANGYLSKVTDKSTQQTFNIRQEFFYYEGVNSSDAQPSGAYIFRPKSQTPIALSDKISIDIIKGDVVSEVRQTINPWAAQVIRLSHNQPFIEFEWIVGPIPKEEKNFVTKEVVTRYITDIQSQNVFYTDANGRQAIKREYGKATSFTYNDTEPVAGNYYPITSFAYIKDETNQLNILTDRAQGMTSKDGYVEIMVHRRCFYDDYFGVEEALDEPGHNGKGLVAMGKHRLFVSSEQNARRALITAAIANYHQPVLAVSSIRKEEKYKYQRQLEFSGLRLELPPIVNLVTLEKWENATTGLARIEMIGDVDDKFAHLDGYEDAFKDFKIVGYKRLKLAANLEKKHASSNRIGTEIETIEINIDRHL